MMKKLLIFSLCFFVGSFPCVGWGQPAEMASGCHCFKDRSYDPARKFAADDYILATSFNSMLATFFDISKKQIIMLRMRMGVGGEDLITSLYLGYLFEVDFQNILAQRSKGQTWKQIVIREKLDSGKIDDLVLVDDNENELDEKVARRAAVVIIGKYFSIPSDVIKNYLKTGLSEKELVLVLGLSTKTARPMEYFMELYRERGQSWGQITNSVGILPGDLDDMISSVRNDL